MRTVGVRVPRAALALVVALLVGGGSSAACSNCDEDLACDDPSTAETLSGRVVEKDGSVVTFEHWSGTTFDVEVLGNVDQLEVGTIYDVPTREGPDGLPRATVRGDCACGPFISEARMAEVLLSLRW